MKQEMSVVGLVVAAIFAGVTALAACEFVDTTKDAGSDSGYYYDTGEGTGSDTGEYYY
ncbi:MAG: hypothetical protein VXW32_11330 [Myxococcota bacterium]|nr:hypothetical protein [Myxococcota bacterium]